MKQPPIAFTVLVYTAIGILIIYMVLGVTGILDKLLSKLKHQPKPNTLPIVKIPHGKRPSKFWSLFWILFFWAILVIGLRTIDFWISGKVPFQPNISNVLFPFFFILAPSYVLVDMLIISRKYYRFTKSNTVKDADFAIVGDINNIYGNCRRIIRSMSDNAQLTKESPNLLKAKIGDSKITVEIKPMKDLRVNVYVVSDVFSILARHDNGNNQNNIKTFTDLLYLSKDIEAVAKLN